jgi:hypothetical protein
MQPWRRQTRHVPVGHPPRSPHETTTDASCCIRGCQQTGSPGGHDAVKAALLLVSRSACRAMPAATAVAASFQVLLVPPQVLLLALASHGMLY